MHFPKEFRFRSPALRMFGIILLLTASTMPESSSPSDFNAALGATPPALQWIMLTQRNVAAQWGFSVQFSSVENSSWILEVGPHGVSATSDDCRSRWQRIQNKELTYFPVSMSCSDTLAVRVTDGRSHATWQLLIPLAEDETGLSNRRYLIPEWRPTVGGPTPTRGWIPMNLSLTETSIVSFSILDARGDQIRTWPPGLLEAGHTTFLWDGKDEFGHLVAKGEYFLRVTGIS